MLLILITLFPSLEEHDSTTGTIPLSPSLALTTGGHHDSPFFLGPGVEPGKPMRTPPFSDAGRG